METAERQYDLNTVAELRHGKLPQLEAKLKEYEEAESQTHLLKEVVSPDEIAEIVGRWTGIQVSRLLEGEREKLLRLEEILHDRVIGQDEAVSRTTEAILRREPESRTQTARWDPSSFSDRPASERPS
jgi:ATP-dependent Clp protease ATP-binding subunit ClpB